MARPIGGKYLIGFRKIKSLCKYSKFHPGVSKYVCLNYTQPSNDLFCIEKTCPILKRTVKIK